MPPAAPNLSKMSLANRVHARMESRKQAKMAEKSEKSNNERNNTVAPSSVVASRAANTAPNTRRAPPAFDPSVNYSKMFEPVTHANFRENWEPILRAHRERRAQREEGPSSVVASTVANKPANVSRKQKKHVRMNPDATYRSFNFNLNHNETERLEPSALRSEHTIGTHPNNGVAGIVPVISPNNERTRSMQELNNRRLRRKILPFTNARSRSIGEVQRGINVPNHHSVTKENLMSHVERFTRKPSKNRGGKRKRLTKKKRN